MRRFVPLALALLLAAPTAAQEGKPDVAELTKKRDAKLAEAWLNAAPWMLSYDEALERSEETGKPIFAYFTRSYRP